MRAWRWGGLVRMSWMIPSPGCTPGCANGEKQKPWSLKGEVVKIPSKEAEILIDFSPKGGPKNLLGKLTPEGGILFPDGNTWSKKQ